MLRHLTKNVCFAGMFIGIVVIPAVVSAQRFGLGPLEPFQSKQVQEELKLSEEQKQKLNEMTKVLVTEQVEIGQELRGLDSKARRERMDELRKIVADRHAEIEKEVNEILQEQQKKRLDQLQMQLRLRRRGTKGLLRDRKLRKMLKITEQQIGEIRDATQAAEEQYRRDVEDARLAAMERILKVLNEDQRKQWDDMLGEPFRAQSKQERGTESKPNQN